MSIDSIMLGSILVSSTKREFKLQTVFIVILAEVKFPSKWLKRNSLPLFKFSLPIRSRSLPCSPGDVPIVSNQMQSVGISNRLVDRRAQELLQLLNYASCAYVQARQWRRNCQVVRGCSHPFFFRDKGQAVEKSWSAAKGWYVSQGLLRRVILCVILDFFPYHNIWKKCTTCGFCLAIYERTHAMLRVRLFHLQFHSAWHKSGKRWSTNRDNDSPRDFHEASYDYGSQSDEEEKFWDVKKSWGGV